MSVQQLYFTHMSGKADRSMLYKQYEALNTNEINELLDMIDEDDIDILLYLALYSYACGDKLPERMYDYLLENEIYYYGELYLRADESVADKLIMALENGHDKNVNHLLCAISAIPCETTKNFLLKNSEKPLPKWATQLHILPIEYTKAAGWCVDKNKDIVKLYSDNITAFESCERSEASPLSPVKALNEHCGYCRQPLTLVFDGEKKFVTCLHCSCYETIFVRQEGESIHWHEKNVPSDFLKEVLVKNPEYIKTEFGLRPIEEQRRPTYTVHQFAEISRTQIGGMPTAVNDVNYPDCPDCGMTMKFKAQLDMNDIDEYGEGLYYFFACEKC